MVTLMKKGLYTSEKKKAYERAQKFINNRLERIRKLSMRVIY